MQIEEEPGELCGPLNAHDADSDLRTDALTLAEEDSWEEIEAPCRTSKSSAPLAAPPELTFGSPAVDSTLGASSSPRRAASPGLFDALRHPLNISA